MWTKISFLCVVLNFIFAITVLYTYILFFCTISYCLSQYIDIVFGMIWYLELNTKPIVY